MCRSAASPFVSRGRQAPSCDEVPTPSFLMPSRSHRRLAAHDNHVSIQGLWRDQRASQGTQNQLASSGVVPRPMPSLLLGGAPATTILLRNVSRRLSQEDAMRLMPRDVWQYDLFYLLFDLPRKHGSGRIFINFERHHDAIAFRNAFHGVQHPRLSRVDADGGVRPLIIEPSRHQGFYQNMDNWRRTLRQDVPACLFPAVFILGKRIDVWALAMPGASSSSSASRP